MTSHKRIDLICIIITLMAILLTVLFINGESLGIKVVYSAEDVDDLSEEAATLITFEGSEISISGNGAYTYDGDVYISTSGYYRFSGTLDDGSIVVNANKSSKVWLILNGVNITCSDGACIRVDTADKVYVNLAEGTDNTLTDSEEYAEELVNDNVNGVIWSSCDLIIDGTGSLEINGNYRHGIKAKDDMTVSEGNITISAPADGIHVNDNFYMSAGSVTVDVDDDAVHSDLSIYVTGGSITALSCYEGLESAVIQVDDGDITLYPIDDGFNANGITSSIGMGGGFGGERGQMRSSSGAEETGFDMSMKNGFGGEHMARDDMSSDNGADGRMPTADPADQSEREDTSSALSDTDNECYVLINGGNITIINETASDADGIDSNKDIIINGGNIYVSLKGDGSNNAMDYGSENGGVISINGGIVVAAGSSGMAESPDSSSAQPSIFYNSSEGVESGTNLTLTDNEGNKLIDTTISCSFTNITLSCPGLEVGETYTLTMGDAEEELTLEEIVSSYGETAGGMGGGMRGSFTEGERPERPIDGNMPEGEPPQPPEGTLELSSPAESENDNDS